jgi:hypothetical protein
MESKAGKGPRNPAGAAVARYSETRTTDCMIWQNKATAAVLEETDVIWRNKATDGGPKP